MEESLISSILRAMIGFDANPPTPGPDHRGLGKSHFRSYDSGMRPRALYSGQAGKLASGTPGDCPEIRTTGVVTGPSADGLTLLKNSPNLNILEITIQPLSAGSFLLYEGSVPLSGEYILSAQQVWSAPGKKMSGDLILKTNSTGSIKFEVRWKSC